MLLLDEPTAFLDVIGRREVLSQMGDWRSEGRILWLATHDLEGVEAAGLVHPLASSSSRTKRRGDLSQGAILGRKGPPSIGVGPDPKRASLKEVHKVSQCCTTGALAS